MVFSTMVRSSGTNEGCSGPVLEDRSAYMCVKRCIRVYKGLPITSCAQGVTKQKSFLKLDVRRMKVPISTA